VIADVNGFRSATRAEDWEHGLVSGNGRQGALAYGGPAALRFTLSHERLFLPLHEPIDPPRTATILPELRALLAGGRYQDAADAVQRLAAEQNDGYEAIRDSDRFVGAATLTYAFAAAPPADAYERSVDFRTGVASQSWRTGHAECFVSRPDDVVVIHLRGEVGGRLTLAPVDGEPPHPVEVDTTASGEWLTLRVGFGYAARWPRALPGYTVLCRVARTAERDREVLLLARTLPGEVDLDGAVAALAALPADYAALLARHTPVHRDLFDRVRLTLVPVDLGVALGNLPDSSDIITDATPSSTQQLFDAGRYAIISACGELPPNLQGVWSGTWRPPWSGDYTVDGNLQSAVAALLPAGTPELMLPVFDLLDGLRDDFAANARALYGAGGVMLPAHLSATHGLHTHFSPRWCQTFWTAGGAWLARLYFDYWRYTGDRVFLGERAWPFLTAVADFLGDFVEIRGGVATFAPSHSPENTPSHGASQACVDATMDVAATADLLRNLLAAARELGREDPREPRWRALLAALPPYRVAPTGELAEWLAPDLADNHAHRHSSHLFPLWYEPDPAIVDDPRLRAAAAEAVRRRLAWWLSDDAGEMAFGLVQLGLAAAHLGMAEEAYATIQAMTRYWRPNLVSTHNLDALFNTDICGGLPAVVLAMLATSAHGRVRLLPALPPAWPAGELTGMALRGPLALERLRWGPTGATAVLRPARDGRLTVAAPAGLRIAEVRGALATEARRSGEVIVEVRAGTPMTVEALPPHR
jgi:hypothetical protein